MALDIRFKSVSLGTGHLSGGGGGVVVVIQRAFCSAYMFSLMHSVFLPHRVSVWPLSPLRVSSQTRQG